jgi:hypothetical protein
MTFEENMKKEGKTRTIRIDPKMFISKPFIKCPKCSELEYGVLSIHRDRYTRRCRKCWHTQSYKLPKLKKKIIYLDQMAISEMMKLLHPKVKTERKAKVKPVWMKLFEKLDRLVKLQLIICPDSSTHLRESIVMAGYYQPLRRMYEQLSNEVSFYDEETIKRFQISTNFRKWLGEKKVPEIDIYDITYGDELEGWQDRLRISVDMFGQDLRWPQEFAKERDEIDANMKGVFKRWQSEKQKMFKDWYEEERAAFGPMILRSYIESIARYAAVVEGRAAPTLGFLLPSVTSVIFAEMHGKLKDQGTADEELLIKSAEYLRSDAIKEIPYAKISSSLFAAMARKAASGQRKPPTKGAVNDVKTIASLAPYCDAMLIDKEFHSLLSEKVDRKPITEFLGLKTQFFSQKNLDEFLEYLDKVERSASKKHLMKVKEVYGDYWGEPYIEMYETT